MLYFTVNTEYTHYLDYVAVFSLLQNISWFKDPLVKEILYKTANCLVTDEGIIVDPDGNHYAPGSLHSDIKELILAYKLLGRTFNIHYGYDVAGEFLLKIGEIQDIYIEIDKDLNLLGVRKYVDRDKDLFDVVCLNTGEHIYSQRILSERISQIKKDLKKEIKEKKAAERRAAKLKAKMEWRALKAKEMGEKDKDKNENKDKDNK